MKEIVIGLEDHKIEKQNLYDDHKPKKKKILITK